MTTAQHTGKSSTKTTPEIEKHVIQVGKIESGSILAKMGLRNGHIITGINGQEITTPDQATEFFETIADGGDVTIKVRKGRGVRKRSQIIKLNIE